MTRLGWSVALAVVAVLALVTGFLVMHHMRTEAPVVTSDQATTTPDVNPSTLSIYTSGEYGFSFFYPSTAIVSDAYTTKPLSGVLWRVGATASGTPIVRIEQGTEEVRVGMSTNTKEVRTCITAGAAETTKGAFTVGSTTWQAFEFRKVGTDNERRVTSYRTVHGTSCYALELFEPLAGMASSTSYTVEDTITSFSFAD